MPYNYKTPGVYVEEISSGARPIESAATSILAMIGLCREAVLAEVEKLVDDPASGVKQKIRVIEPVPTPKVPTLVTSWTQFTTKFGGMDQSVPGGFLHDAMYGYFNNGGMQAYVVGIPVSVDDRTEAGPAAPELPRGQGYLLNAAGEQALRLTTRPLNPGEQIRIEVTAAEAGAPEGTFNLVVQQNGEDPKTIANLSPKGGRGLRNVAQILATETDSMVAAEVVGAGLPVVGGTTTLIPVPPALPAAPTSNGQPGLKDKLNLDLFRGNAAQRTGIAGLEAIDEVTLLACPDIVAVGADGKPAAAADDVKAVQRAMLDHCEAMKDRFAILDCPKGLSVDGTKNWRNTGIGFDSKYAALYYPWIKVDKKLVPPSGHVAGVYARVDAERGVFKAPANETVKGVIDLELNVSRNEQDLLNPIGVNCIRAFPGQGIKIWGARTLSSSDAQWRYIPVRRLFCNIEESILQSTSWIVFEPNNQILWRQIKRDVTAFLTVQWRAGALFGATPEQAFYVKCDEETNPAELRDLGYCVVEVGLAPVKPAEFVVFKVSQMRDGAGAASE